MLEDSDGHLPYMSTAIPGIGGTIRVVPEDFCVEELPRYLPCGEGEHLYVQVTKRGLSTPHLVGLFSSTFGVKAKTIGVAGLKDARAVSTQMVSLQGVSEERVADFTHDRVLGIRVVGWHRNRLRTGHHAGNLFRLVVRGVTPQAGELVPRIVHEVLRRGVPNYFGPQRQGRTGNNYQIGAELLRDASRRESLPKAKRMWFLNAYQSFVFNRVVCKRIDWIDRLLEGDWAMKHGTGACFHVQDSGLEQPRVEAFEISPTGPLFGSRAPWATGAPGDLELDVLREIGETPESLRQAAVACRFRGERRPLRVPLGNLEWSVEGDILYLSFSLPPGAYATSVLREIMKTQFNRSGRGHPKDSGRDHSS